MTNHQKTLLALGQFDQLEGFAIIQREGFLDENILAGLERLFGFFKICVCF